MFQKDKIIIQAYRGFAAPDYIFMHGRVLEDENIKVTSKDRRLRTLWNNFKRFESDEVPGAAVKIEIGREQFQLTSDKEGYYTLEQAFRFPTALIDNNEAFAKCSLADPAIGDFTCRAPVFVPDAKAQFGVISDIDDTVLQTFVSGRFKMRMIYHSFLKNPYQRNAMEGMADFYQLLERGKDGKQNNPFFYLSDSPWNIYDAITTFLDAQHLPKGPIFLRDYGWPEKKADDYRGHKLHYLEKVLKAFPDMPFVLLGDTASHDADYYLQMVQEFPGRIQRIYIRKTRNTWNAQRITRLVNAHKDAPIRLVLNSREMKEDALKLGLIG